MSDFIYICGGGNNGATQTMTLEYIALVVSLLAIALIFASTLITGISPVPTSPRVRRTMMSVLPDRLPGKAGAPIYELGSGWGGMALALARRYPDHPVIGCEVSLLPWAFSRLRLLVRPQPNLSLVWMDYRGADLGEAALVVCYLFPGAMQELTAKFESELSPGALVLSNTFAIRDWRPVDEVSAPDQYASKVYLYETSPPSR